MASCVTFSGTKMISDGPRCFSISIACFFFTLQPKIVKYKTGISDLVS